MYKLILSTLDKLTWSKVFMLLIVSVFYFLSTNFEFFVERFDSDKTKVRDLEQVARLTDKLKEELGADAVCCYVYDPRDLPFLVRRLIYYKVNNKDNLLSKVLYTKNKSLVSHGNGWLIC